MVEREGHYEAVLADLKSERARLDLLIAGIEAKMAGQPAGLAIEVDSTAGSAAAVSVVIHPDSFYGLSIIEASKKYLKMARRAQHLDTIAGALEQGGLKRPTENVLGGILVRAAKGREVVRVGKGTWGLAEWYPRPPKEPTDDRKKRPVKKPQAKKATATAKIEPKKSAPVKTAQPKAARPSDVALAFIRAEGRPVHALQITKHVNTAGLAVSRMTVESTLNRQVKAGKLQKTAPSTFALPGLQAAS